MVKRYPHTAIITVETNGGLVNGEWVEGSTEEVKITGRFDPTSSSDIIRLNTLGNEVVVRGEFYTPRKPIEGATRLVIPEMGVSRDIISWHNWQTHNVISV